MSFLRNINNLTLHDLKHASKYKFNDLLKECLKSENATNIPKINKTKNISQKFCCDLCPKIYMRKIDLKDHKLNKHFRNAKPYICNICNKGFANGANLIRHKKKFHEKEFKKLNKKKIIKKKLNKKKIIIKKKLNKKKIIIKKKLNKKINTNINNSTSINKCKYCNLEFKIKSELKNHEHYFHDIEYFNCNVPGCNFITKRERDLPSHIKTHSKIKIIKKKRKRDLDQDIKLNNKEIDLINNFLKTQSKKKKKNNLKKKNLQNYFCEKCNNFPEGWKGASGKWYHMKKFHGEAIRYYRTYNGKKPKRNRFNYENS
jgi:glucan-binding YG repeat protein